VHRFEIARAQERLRAGRGRYEIVHESPGLEIGVYVLVAPEPDGQRPHEDDEIYVPLAGSGVLVVEREKAPVRLGEAIFVEARQSTGSRRTSRSASS
jgi:mannose-6-phosphate isomerase-like protein (cupin superfamily)